MLSYLVIAFGGAIGSVFRVFLSKSLPAFIINIPVSIMFVNIFGCFVMGLLSALMSNYWQATDNMKYFLLSGILGGFTTFSSFALEYGTLVEKNQYLHALTYGVLSVVLSLFFFFIGIKLAGKFL